MSRIEKTLSKIKAKNSTALIPFVTAGYPNPAITPNLMHAMVLGGADIIELGVPFSDPSADGPIIQKAGECAIKSGIGLTQVLAMVLEFRQQNTETPVVIMGYANPIEAYAIKHGATAFARDAQAAGVDGVLIVDYPPNECVAFANELRSHNIDFIFLLAPTSTEARMSEISEIASGYVYYISLKGITGSGSFDISSVREKMEIIRNNISIPVAVGFGIRDASGAKAIGSCADAVVIGSKIVQLISNQTDEEACRLTQDFLSTIRLALEELTP
jgi:tryptophan synthase alpha chain